MACWLCVAACPSGCIEIVPAAVDMRRVAGKLRVDLGRCRCCGNCVEACPVETLVMEPAGAVSSRDRCALIRVWGTRT